MFAPVYGSYSNIAGKQEEIEMFDKLEDLLIRLEEILSELQEPDVASDPNRFRKLMKEQSELTPIVEAYKEYKACKQNIEESLELLNEESDEDMRELAKEELNESKARVEELEHELKILLLPKDPNDDKNVVVEIRAGAGGDEAALFAAEIYRMYLHYAESKRWKVELVECEEIGIGGMKNVTFSYSFDKKFLNFFRSGTLYVTGENLLTATKYLGLDPEFSYSYSDAMQGFDYAKMMQPKSIKFGVNLNF